MTITPKLSTENIDYVFSVAGKILSESSDRLPSTPGEAYSARLIMNELKIIVMKHTKKPSRLTLRLAHIF